MILPAFINVNRGGIPTLSSRGVAVSTTNVAFDFYNHPSVGAPYRGLLVIRIAQSIPEGTTTTLPIVFTTEGGQSTPVTTIGGDAVTVADIEGTGVYLFWYERSSGTLQILTGIS